MTKSIIIIIIIVIIIIISSSSRICSLHSQTCKRRSLGTPRWPHRQHLAHHLRSTDPLEMFGTHI
jgi:hypothetical protein